MPLLPWDIAMLILIGLIAGGVGGMIGVGGSVIMIPAMALLFAGRPWAAVGGQHLWQASAMLVNVAVALPAARRHFREGAFRRDLFELMLPATIVAIIAGVLLSDQLPGWVLQRIFALFLVFIIIETVVKVLRRRAEHGSADARVTPLRGGAVGGAMGFSAGLLGIGGGGIAVPLAHKLCRLPLKNCIAVSSAIMCITAAIGGAIKIALLPGHGHPIHEPFLLFLLLAPSAMIGSHIGAGLTHRISLNWLRIIFAVVMTAAAVRLWQASEAGAARAETRQGDTATP